MTPVFVYDRLRELPALVRSMCFSHDAWIVGGAAVYLCGLSNTYPRDWDVIVPPSRWQAACKSLPYKSQINTMGGVKVIGVGFEMDVWASDLGQHFAESFGDFDLVAVFPKTMQAAVCTKR